LTLVGRRADVLERERGIENHLKQSVTRVGGLYLKFTSPGNNGVPDRVVIFPGGTVYFVELKRPGGKPRKIQQACMRRMRHTRAHVVMINSRKQADHFIKYIERRKHAPGIT
jgi:hypothetical protein